MSVKPTRTTVISVATATTLLVAGAAAATIGTSYRHVTIEVDGVSRDVSGFFTTAGDALNTAGVSVGAHDLVAPAADQTVSNGDTVVVRTATPYDVTVDGSQTVAWSTASTASGILSALPAQTSSMAADRSFVRAEMPLGEGGETVHVVADGTTTDVVASADEGTSAILEKAGVTASPIDRVTLENSGGETTVRVARVVRGKSSTTTEIPFETEEREDPEAEEGTEKVVQEGVAGSEVTESYQETIDGNVTVTAVLTTTRTEPTTHIVSKGTKEKKKAEDPKETPASSSDSSSSDSSSVRLLFRRLGRRLRGRRRHLGRYCPVRIRRKPLDQHGKRLLWHVPVLPADMAVRGRYRPAFRRLGGGTDHACAHAPAARRLGPVGLRLQARPCLT